MISVQFWCDSHFKNGICCTACAITDAETAGVTTLNVALTLIPKHQQLKKKILTNTENGCRCH
jgi:hypothetical protein